MRRRRAGGYLSERLRARGGEQWNDVEDPIERVEQAEKDEMLFRCEYQGRERRCLVPLLTYRPMSPRCDLVSFIPSRQICDERLTWAAGRKRPGKESHGLLGLLHARHAEGMRGSMHTAGYGSLARHPRRLGCLGGWLLSGGER